VISGVELLDDSALAAVAAGSAATTSRNVDDEFPVVDSSFVALPFHCYQSMLSPHRPRLQHVCDIQLIAIVIDCCTS